MRDLRLAVGGVVVLSLIAAQALGWLFDPPGPSLLTPLPLVFILPAFAEIPFAIIAAAALLAPLLLFSLVLRGPLRLRVLVPLLYLAVAAASVFTFAAGWQYGLDWEGPVYTWGTAILSTLMACTIGALLCAYALRPSRDRLFAATFLLFAWLYTYAMPYLGETP